MAIELVSVHFGSGRDDNDPLAPLRTNLGTSPLPPIQPRGASSVPTQSPIALIHDMLQTAGEVDPESIPVTAVFRRTSGEQSVRVQASCVGASLGIQSTNSVQEFFGADDQATVSLVLAQEVPRAVAKHDITLRWTATSGTQTRELFTQHTVYVLLAPPGLPWETSLGRSEGWVWTDVLDRACEWAAGAASPEEATKRITGKINELGLKAVDQGGLRYDENPHYAIISSFQCADFLRHLQGQNPQSFVNCSDVATIVSTFTNALGATLRQARCSPATTRNVRLIGTAEDSVKDFLFHELAWQNPAGSNEPVWDGCLTVYDQLLTDIRFDDYAPRVFATASTPLGLPFSHNRTVFPSVPPPTAVDPGRELISLHPEAGLWINTPLGTFQFQPNEEVLRNLGWTKSPAVARGEDAWEFIWPSSDNARAKLRLSSFPGADEARTYLLQRVAGVSEKLIQWLGYPGLALSTTSARAAYFQTGNVAVVAQANFGNLDLRPALQFVISLLQPSVNGLLGLLNHFPFL